MMLRRQLLLAEIAAGAAPVVLLLLISGSSGPASTSAMSVQTNTPTAPIAAPAKALSPEQARVREFVRGITLEPPMPSPMDHPSLHPVEVVEPRPDAGGPRTVPNDPLSALRVTSIVGNNEGGLALINGKVYKLGEQPTPGITIREIDARLNTVTLELPDGSIRKVEKRAEHSKQRPSRSPPTLGRPRTPGTRPDDSPVVPPSERGEPKGDNPPPPR